MLIRDGKRVSLLEVVNSFADGKQKVASHMLIEINFVIEAIKLTSCHSLEHTLCHR